MFYRIAKSRTQPRGAALMVAVIAVLGIAIVAISLSQIAMTGSTVTATSEDRAQSWMLVQAGFQAALQEINAGKDLDGDGVVGSASKTFGPDNRYSYAATVYSGASTDGTYVGQNIGTGNKRIISKGIVKAVGGKTTNDTVRAGESITKDSSVLTKFPMQIFGDISSRCSGNMYMDAYNSALGTYESQVAAAGGAAAYHASAAGKDCSIGSNGDMSFGGSCDIWGNAIAGVGKSVTGSDKVHGTITNRTSAYVLPVPSIPDTTSAATSATTNGTVNSGSYHWSSFSSKPHDVVTIPAGATVNIVIDNGMDLKGTWTLGTGCTVNIYLKAGGISANSLGPNVSSMTNQFNIISASTGGIKINGNYTFYGTIYAPYMAMSGNGNGQIFGAFMVSDISKLNGTLDLHADNNATTPGIKPLSTLVACKELVTH